MNVRASMMDIVVTTGMKVVEAMLEEDRIRICGPKHARIAGRKVTRGGPSAASSFWVGAG